MCTHQFSQSLVFCFPLPIISAGNLLRSYFKAVLKLLDDKKKRLVQGSELLGKYTGIFFSSLEMDQTKAAQEISIYDQRQIPTAWNKAVSVKMRPLKSGDENWTLRSILHFVWKTCASHQISLRILNTKRTDENKNE